MAWLKQASTKWQRFIVEISGVQGDPLAPEDVSDALEQKYQITSKQVRVQEIKEGSVYDNPQYQRQDENKGESGDFKKDHIDQERRDKGVDVGPVSLTPGTPDVLAPQVFD